MSCWKWGPNNLSRLALDTHEKIDSENKGKPKWTKLDEEKNLP